MAAPPYSRVKVFGERGTGTNFFARLIYANFHAEMLVHADPLQHPAVQPLRQKPFRERHKGAVAERIEDHLHRVTMHATGGWKHACLTDHLFETLDDADEVLVLCIVRHPAMWVQSFMRKPFASFLSEPPDIDTLLKTPWVTRARDEMPDLVLEGPATLWRRKVESYLDHALRRPNVKIVRHEDVLRNVDGVLDLIAPLMTARRETWGVPKGYGRTWEEGQERDFWQIREALPEDPWREISEEAAAILRTQIGAELLERFQYT